ncbi:MAG: hypothetical protein ABIR57_10140 [Aeromicrobium sp.]
MAELAVQKLIYLAPFSGSSGVGDYSDDFALAITPHVGELVEVRYPAARSASVRDVWRYRRELRQLLAESDPSSTVIHSELSGGSIVPFWATFGLKGVARTVTIHDAPRPVWFPFLTKGVANKSMMTRAIHGPLNALCFRMERRSLRRSGVVVLTRAGAQSVRAARIGATVLEGGLLIPHRPDVPAIDERPRAVGLFGHVYKGKGFSLLTEIREALDDDVAIRVAGRGTESLAPIAGVEVLGEVVGAGEDEFFASIRLLLLPYRRRPVMRLLPFHASATHARAVAYRTPSMALRSQTMDELAAEGTCLIVDGGPAELAHAAGVYLSSDDAAEKAVHGIDHFRERMTDESLIEPFLELWRRPR